MEVAWSDSSKRLIPAFEYSDAAHSTTACVYPPHAAILIAQHEHRAQLPILYS